MWESCGCLEYQIDMLITMKSHCTLCYCLHVVWVQYYTLLSRALSFLAGSSTACLLSLNCQTGLLHSANLGDSGYLILRHGKVVSRSRNVLHHFNCPYQLSNPPPGFHLNALSDRYGGFGCAWWIGVFFCCVHKGNSWAVACTVGGFGGLSTPLSSQTTMKLI